MAIGEKIKKLRQESGLTQRQLARNADVDQGGLSKIERGLKGNLTLEMLRRLAKALGCSVPDLLDEEDKRSPRKTAA